MDECSKALIRLISLSGLSSYYNWGMLSHSLSPNKQRRITSCATICGGSLEQHIFCPEQ